MPRPLPRLLALLLAALPLAAQAPAEPPPPPTATPPVEAATAAEPAPGPLGLGEAALLGLVEGVTEFLPVSSTGHLILTGHFLGLGDTEVLRGAAPGVTGRKDAVDAYLVIIQAGAIAAVGLIYWRRLGTVAAGLLGRSADGLRLARNLLLAFLPAVVLALAARDFIKAQLFSVWPVVLALAVGAVVMLWAERWQRSHPARAELDLPALSPWQALAIGLAQCFALWPGMSRSMAAMVGGYLVGLTPARAAEFSFLLGFLTLGAASAYEMVKAGPEVLRQLGLAPALMGVAVATVSAALAVRWFVAFLQRFGLAAFAWYRLVLAAVLAAVFFSGQPV